MNSITQIRRVTPVDFAGWLKNHAETFRERAFKIDDITIYRNGIQCWGSRESPTHIVIEGVYVCGVPVGPEARLSLRVETITLISFDLSPLDSERTEIQTKCSDNSQVIRFLHDELMPLIEQRWPAVTNEPISGQRSGNSNIREQRKPRRDAIRRVALLQHVTEHEHISLTSAIAKYGGDAGTTLKYRDSTEVKELLAELKEDRVEVNRLKQWAVNSVKRKGKATPPKTK